MPADEDLVKQWRQRLDDARHRLDFAQIYVKEVQQDRQLGYVPSPDGDYAYRRAIRAESEARVEYLRILRIFTDVLQGKGSR